jgi:hypothetical protein
MFAFNIIVIFYISFFKVIEDNYEDDNFMDEENQDEVKEKNWWIGLALIWIRVLVMIHGFAALMETPVKKEEEELKIFQD